MKLLNRVAAATATLACLALATPGLASASASTNAEAARVPACKNSDLAASFKYTGGGAGHFYGKMRLRNVSGHRCHTGGYGGVSYVGFGDGTQIGHAAIREDGKVRSYVLEPGQRVVSKIAMTNAEVYDKSKCRPAEVDGFRTYVPNAYKSQFVAYKTLGCKNKRVHLIHQKPYRR